MTPIASQGVAALVEVDVDLDAVDITGYNAAFVAELLRSMSGISKEGVPTGMANFPAPSPGGVMPQVSPHRYLTPNVAPPSVVTPNARHQAAVDMAMRDDYLSTCNVAEEQQINTAECKISSVFFAMAILLVFSLVLGVYVRLHKRQVTRLFTFEF